MDGPWTWSCRDSRWTLSLALGSVALRDSALVGKVAACAGVTLGSQLVPPCIAVLLPAA